MAKDRTQVGTSHEQQPTRQRLAIELPLPLLATLIDSRAAVMELCIHTGLEVLQFMMEQDRTALCGPARQHAPDRSAYRGGHAPAEVTLGGRRVAVRRPRVRSLAEEELVLPSFRWAAGRDALERATWEAVASGVATRRYEGLQPELPEGVRGRASSRSAVSRRFVALSQKKLSECLSRSLADLDLWVVMIDGIAFLERMVLVALGIAADGRKHVLGLWEGTTENAAVARSLLRDLVERGLPADRPLLLRDRRLPGPAQGAPRELRRPGRGPALPGAQDPQRAGAPAGGDAAAHPQGPARRLSAREREDRDAPARAAGAGARGRASE
ncbi:MAG: transposase, partial [Candidatus Rokuibacteriota bacterium]